MKKNLKKNRAKAKQTTSRKGKPSGITYAMKMKVKKGDTVKVLSGKDKGKTGEVVRVFPKLNKIVVEGIAIAKRSLRSSAKGQSGRIVERAMPIHASNVAVTTKKAKAAKAEKTEKKEEKAD
jgi:large subunit ribosomal protein L24